MVVRRFFYWTTDGASNEFVCLQKFSNIVLSKLLLTFIIGAGRTVQFSYQGTILIREKKYMCFNRGISILDFDLLGKMIS